MRKSGVYLALISICCLWISCMKQVPSATSVPAVKLRMMEGYPASVIRAITDREEAVGGSGKHAARLYSIASKREEVATQPYNLRCLPGRFTCSAKPDRANGQSLERFVKGKH